MTQLATYESYSALYAMTPTYLFTLRLSRFTLIFRRNARDRLKRVLLFTGVCVYFIVATL